MKRKRSTSLKTRRRMKGFDMVAVVVVAGTKLPLLLSRIYGLVLVNIWDSQKITLLGKLCRAVGIGGRGTVDAFPLENRLEDWVEAVESE